jgi:hypothetical protein
VPALVFDETRARAKRSDSTGLMRFIGRAVGMLSPVS